MMVRRLTRVLPKPSVISSSSRSTGGSRPAIHNTAATHASQEIVRSISLATPDAGKAAARTRAKSRIAASDKKTGTAIRSTTALWWSSMARRARSVSNSASSGNSRPSKVFWPNQIESFGWSRPNQRVMPQASATQAASKASSSSKPCVPASPKRRNKSSITLVG